MKKQKIVILIFLLLLFVNTEVSAQGVKCEDLEVEGLCVEIEFILMREDFKTPSEHKFPDLVSVGDYLVIRKITVTNKPGIVYESKNTSNVSLKINVHPIGSEKAEIAQLIIPPLKTNDVYEVTYLGELRYYESKLNGEVIETKHFDIWPKKLSMDGWWQINEELEPLKWHIDPAIGYTSFGYSTIINEELENYYFKVYSNLEITALKIAEKNLETARWNLGLAGFLLFIAFITILIQRWCAKKQEKSLREVTGELKGVARNINTLTEKLIDQEQENFQSEKKKDN